MYDCNSTQYEKVGEKQTFMANLDLSAISKKLLDIFGYGGVDTSVDISQIMSGRIKHAKLYISVFIWHKLSKHRPF